MLASAEISLVILKKGIASASLPSKLFSIMASGRPVIASVDGSSETSKLVSSSQAGLCVQPENPTQLAEAILSLRDASCREKMGRDGRAWVENHHSLRSAADKFERLLFSVIGNS